MYIIIEFYIVFSILLLLFNLFFVLTKNIRLKRLNQRKKKSKEILEVEFERFHPRELLSPAFIRFLENNTGRTKNLLLLEKEMKKRRLYRKEIKEAIKPYIFQKMEHYRHKSDSEQAYYAYFLTLFDYEKDEANERNYKKILSYLDSKSFYVFSNTMDAIYRFRDPYILIAALRKVDEREGFYHIKLLSDGLLNFDCCLVRLTDLMLREFYNFRPNIQLALMNYFRLKEIDVSDFALNILKQEEVDDEVYYAAMRYFARFPRKEAKEIFIKILEDEENYWILELLAIQGLEAYDEEEVRRLIRKKVTSKNWEVRTSAIHYLYNHHLRKDEILEVLSYEDRFATEQLYYYYEDDEKFAPLILERLEVMQEEIKKAYQRERELEKND